MSGVRRAWWTRRILQGVYRWVGNGPGEPATPESRELNPDCPAGYKKPHNTMSVVLAQMVVLPPKSWVVAMGRLAGIKPDQVLPQLW